MVSNFTLDLRAMENSLRLKWTVQRWYFVVGKPSTTAFGILIHLANYNAIHTNKVTAAKSLKEADPAESLFYHTGRQHSIHLSYPASFVAITTKIVTRSYASPQFLCR